MTVGIKDSITKSNTLINCILKIKLKDRLRLMTAQIMFYFILYTCLYHPHFGSLIASGLLTNHAFFFLQLYPIVSFLVVQGTTV
jgi:hypothetical protein